MKTKLLIVACMLFCVTSFAQIQIDSSEVYINELVVIGNANFGRIFPSIGPSQDLCCRICKEGTIYGIRLKGYRSGIEVKEGNFVGNDQYKDYYTIFFALGKTIDETKQSINIISNLIKTTDTQKITKFKDIEGRDIELRIEKGWASAHINGFSVGIDFNKYIINRVMNHLNKKAEKKVAKVLEKHKVKSVENGL